jgi:hypothetical protein
LILPVDFREVKSVLTIGRSRVVRNRTQFFDTEQGVPGQLARSGKKSGLSASPAGLFGRAIAVIQSAR